MRAAVPASTAPMTQELLAEAGAVLAGSLDYDATLNAVAKLVVPRFADWCVVYVREDDGDVRRVAMAHATPAGEAIMRRLSVEYPRRPGYPDPILRVAESGESLLVPTITREDLARHAYGDDHRRLLEQLDPRSAVIVPLVARGRVLGALGCNLAGDARRYGPEDLRLAEELARRCAYAVDNARLFGEQRRAREEAEQAVARMARLQAVTAALSAPLPPGEVARVVADESRAALGATAGSVWLLTRDGAALVLAHASGYPPGALDTWARMPVDAQLPLPEAIRTGASIFLTSPDDTLARYPLVARSGMLSQAWACVPLMLDGGVLGGLTLAFAEAQTFPPEDRALLVTLAHQCAQALERARLDAEERRLRDRATFLAELANDLAAAHLHLPAILDRLVRRVADELGDGSAVFLATPEGLLHPEALHHRDPEASALARRLLDADPIRPGEGISGRVFERGEPVLLADIPRDELLRSVKPGHRALVEQHPTRGLVAVPLRLGDRRLGVVTAWRTASERPYTADDQALLQEVADRAAFAVENARLYAAAQEAVAARDRFLSVAAHELKTPLTSVKGGAQLLALAHRQGKLDGALLDRYISTIDASATRLGQLVTDLLDVSRLRTGQLGLRPRAFDLARLVADVVARHEARLDGRHRLVVSPPSGCAIEGDPERLEQVVENLLDNAVKYSPGGGDVLVTVEQEAERATLRVRDPGIGLPEGSAEVIFQPFGRAPNAGTIPGMGLGLHICRGIVEAHGGRMWAESDGERRGTTILVELPCGEHGGE